MRVKQLGIELWRGLSVYAVILVHSGDESWGIAIDSGAITFRLYFYFAVPFFLATAFYLTTAHPETITSRKFWRSRIQRLVIPYAIWSAIFLVSRVIVFTLSNRPERLQKLLQDPLSLAFLGAASYHLYFLPLLLTGTLWVLLVPLLNQIRFSKYSLAALSMISVFLYHVLEASGNAFQLGENVAFQSLLSAWQLSPEHYPWLRLALVEVAWMIRCLPYFFIALTLNRFVPYAEGFHRPVRWAIAFLLSNTLGKLLLPGALQEVLLAYTLLLFSLALSKYLRDSSASYFVSSMGACSFGIYLIHPFVMNFVKPVMGKMLPIATASVSITSMLLLSIPCFLLSWLAVVCLSKHKFIAKYLFGA